MCKFRLNKCADVRRTLQKTCDLVASGELDTKQANCIIFACQTALALKKLEVEVAEKNDNHSISIDMGLSQVIDV